MPRRGIGPENDEEIREPVHGGAHVCLRAAALVPHVLHVFAAFAADAERVQPGGEVEAVGEDDGVGGEGDLIGGGGAGGDGGVGVCAAGTEGDGFGVDAGEGLGGEVDVGVAEAGEPGGVEDAAFATDAVVGGKDFVVFFRDAFTHMAEEVGFQLGSGFLVGGGVVEDLEELELGEGEDRCSEYAAKAGDLREENGTPFLPYFGTKGW